MNEHPTISRRSRQTGRTVELWRAADYGLMVEDGGPWVTVCPDHGNNVQHDTRKLAEGWLADMAMWCPECQNERTAASAR